MLGDAAADVDGDGARADRDGGHLERGAFVWELVWTRARVRALEETAFVAQLFQKRARISIQSQLKFRAKSKNQNPKDQDQDKKEFAKPARRHGDGEEESQKLKCSEKELTTLPGLSPLRLQVLVSVVQQLKHLLRTRSLSFVLASSV